MLFNLNKMKIKYKLFIYYKYTLEFKSFKYVKTQYIIKIKYNF